MTRANSLLLENKGLNNACTGEFQSFTNIFELTSMVTSCQLLFIFKRELEVMSTGFDKCFNPPTSSRFSVVKLSL